MWEKLILITERNKMMQSNNMWEKLILITVRNKMITAISNWFKTKQTLCLQTFLRWGKATVWSLSKKIVYIKQE